MKDDEAEVSVVNGITHMLKCYPKDVIAQIAELAEKGDEFNNYKAESLIAFKCTTAILMEGHTTEKDFEKNAGIWFALQESLGKNPNDWAVAYYNKDTKWIDNVIFYDGPSTDEDEGDG
jgi:hypothetical protein